MARADSRRLFERQVVFAPVPEQVAYGRCQIGPVGKHATRNFETRLEGNWICRTPTGVKQAAKNVVSLAFQSDVDRVPRYSPCVNGRHRFGCQTRLALVMAPVIRRDQIGRGEIENERYNQRACGPPQIFRQFPHANDFGFAIT